MCCVSPASALGLDINYQVTKGFPGGSGGKESACNAGDTGLIPGLGIFLEEGNGNPFKYSCLRNLMHRGAWRATVHEVTKESDTI